MSYQLSMDGLDSAWQSHFKSFGLDEELKKIEAVLSQEEGVIYPKSADVLSAFKLCSLKDLKLVIIGQDPYHNFGQAHGLAFSVLPPTPLPPSLRNIFIEIERSLRIANLSTDLTPWARQGVLLLNTALTVVENKPAIHAELWESFSLNLIRSLAGINKALVWALWGNHARAFEKHIKEGYMNAVLKTSHPSPLSASRGFKGSDIFIKINDALRTYGYSEMNWQTDV